MNRPICRTEAHYNYLQCEAKLPIWRSVRVARWTKRAARRARRRALRFVYFDGAGEGA